MMINKTTEFINYRHSFHTGLERTPNFIRREAGSLNAKDSDVIEISEEARQQLLKNSSSALVKAVSHDIGALVLQSERDADAGRRLKINVLSGRIRRGMYDFESLEKIYGAGNEILAQLIREK